MTCFTHVFIFMVFVLSAAFTAEINNMPVIGLCQYLIRQYLIQSINSRSVASQWVQLKKAPLEGYVVRIGSEETEADEEDGGLTEIEFELQSRTCSSCKNCPICVYLILSQYNLFTDAYHFIGVLAQELSSPQPLGSSYIAASYVKYLESAGARVVPVKINQTQDEYARIFNSINGVLFPGGDVSIESSGYARAARIFYKLAIKANINGDYFPIWGTCLGFEELTFLTSGKFLLSTTNTTGVALPLIFTNDSVESRLFSNFPSDVMSALASEPITENSHRWSLTVKSYNESQKLRNFYRVLTTNYDGKLEFVSTMEAYDFPFYGTQWHPEKNAFEWTRPYIPHSPAAVRTTFFAADFFVNEARKSSHRFSSLQEELDALIYNYCPIYSGKKSAFEQIYVFK